MHHLRAPRVPGHRRSTGNGPCVVAYRRHVRCQQGGGPQALAGTRFRRTASTVPAIGETLAATNQRSFWSRVKTIAKWMVAVGFGAGFVWLAVTAPQPADGAQGSQPTPVSSTRNPNPMKFAPSASIPALARSPALAGRSARDFRPEVTWKQ